MPDFRIEKIVSGGQTGADRVALDFAIAHEIPHGGWCPLGRFAEDGRIADRYQLVEATEPTYIQRTEWNVRDSDGTVIFSLARDLTGGSLATLKFARKHGRPFLHIGQCVHSPEVGARQLLDFVRRHRVRVINVAGPRVSTEPEIGEYVRQVLEAAVRLGAGEFAPAPGTD